LEIRYAEVLLNYAEAACGAGEMGVAVEQLKKIRARVGYTSTNNFGLQTNLSSDQSACFAAILYERQIELAYEGKRFDDLRRWMLLRKEQKEHLTHGSHLVGMEILVLI
jgi:hypothetical protein